MEAVGAFWQSYAVNPLSAALTFVHDVVGSYAIAIMFFTIVIRLLLIPLSIRQIQSQRRMQLIQPEVAQIRKKYKGDRQAEAQAMSKLYKEHGANPVSGCLPMLVQLPVLLALYGGILTLSGRGVLNEQFLWFNLAREDATIRVVGEAAPTLPADIHIATGEEQPALEAGVAADFSGKYANFRVTVDQYDEAGALAALREGRAQLAVVDNVASTTDLPTNARTERFIHSAALLVQRDHSLTRLTWDQLGGVLRGEILDWSELGGLPGPIQLHTTTADLGTLPLLERVALDGDPIRARVVRHPTFEALQAEIAQNNLALGLSIPMGVEGIRMLNIEPEGGARAFQPYLSSLQNGEYPLVREVWAYTPPPATNTDEFFLDWWDSGAGQSAAQQAGFTRVPIESTAFGVGGFYISVLALLAGFFQWIQARMMVQRDAEGQAATMNRIMQFMPLIVVIFAWTFQAGLVLYWVLSSIIGIIQQYFTTGTGALVPRHWPIARDALADHRAKIAAAKAALDAPTNGAETVEADSPRRRRRRRRGG